jgi:thiamine biosynthesis lipoprotein
MQKKRSDTIEIEIRFYICSLFRIKLNNMKVLTSLLAGLFLISATPKKEVEKNAQRLYVVNYENVLGTSLEFKITSTNEQEASKAENAALTEIDRLAKIFSAYDANSEFTKWMNAGLNKPVRISKELFDMLNLFEQWKARTNGALNASAAVAGNLWAEAAKKQQMPSKAAIEAAIKSMNLTHYQLDAKNLTATRLTEAPLVMNTFAKSYIINLAAEAALANSKVSAVVVNIGGDLVVKGDVNDLVNVTNPQANAENDAPLAYLSVKNMAVATSGNYRRGVQIGKHWYSHIIDPRSGKPVEEIISATVVAQNATDAGALATAFNVLSLKESAALAATIPGVEYLIVTANGKKIESAGWNNLTTKAADKEDEKVKQPALPGAEKPWDPKFELEVSFSFNAIEGNGHRPFAAIWIEDANKISVRNLALWYNKPKWIPDLRNWYRINGDSFRADKNNYASVTGATRSPGKYTIKWDGKNDKGEYVPQGKYTIIIETSKEHGTDEILRQEMELKKSAKKTSVTGNVEISSVNFDFHKK